MQTILSHLSNERSSRKHARYNFDQPFAQHDVWLTGKCLLLALSPRAGGWGGGGVGGGGWGVGGVGVGQSPGGSGAIAERAGGWPGS